MAGEDDADLRRLREAVLGIGHDPRLSELVELVSALVERSHRREMWLHASHDITRTLLTSNDPSSTLRMVAERARELAYAPVAAIALPDAARPGNLVFDVVDGVGMDAEKLSGVSVPIADTGSGLVFRTGRSAVLSEYGRHVVDRADNPDIEYPPRVRDLDSAIAVPLAFGAEVRGVLVVARLAGDVPFTDEDVRQAETFAAQATIALEIARAEEDRRRLAVFTDRDRIARDLHDLVIQRLFAIGLGLQGMRQSALRDTADRIGVLVAELDQTIRDIRRTIFSLHEVAEGSARLRAAVMAAAQEASGPLGFQPRIGFDGPIDSVVPDPIRPDLLATIREALSNTARHSGATEVSVEVSVDRSGRWLTLVVTDNGSGLSDRDHRRSGLANLGERAGRWGGTLELDRPVTGGTRLRWTVPLFASGTTQAQEVP